MQGNGGVYAVKRRRKPVQKNVKPPPVKINPSKRHRDRLNEELDRLTGLLPFSEEARGRLDKLSVLRLSVGYLKVQSYFHAVLPKNTRSAPLVSSNRRNGQRMSLDGVSLSEGDLLLQALNGFVLVVTSDGTVFYTSSTIRDYLGFHQSDVVHQSMYDLIHVDDRETFKCQLHFALNPSDGGTGVRGGGSSQTLSPRHLPPENSSFLERSFCCRLRCLLDNTSGFMALNFSGRLKYLHLQGSGDGASAHPQLALFAIATPLQSPAVMEIRTKTFIFQTKHRMDFAPLGVDTRGKLALGYTEVELLTPGSGYQFIHAADMLYCADNHLRMIKTGESVFSFFRLLTKRGQWLWVQAQARIVFKGGKPDFIISRQKALTNEEGEEHLHQRRRQLPFTLTTGEGVLYDASLDVLSIPAPGTSESTAEKPLNPASILGAFQRQDHSIYTRAEKPSPPLPIFSQTPDADRDQPRQASLEQAFLDSHALLSVPGHAPALRKRPSAADLTSEAMMESLEQILGDIGDGGVEGLEVEDVELKEWENTLLRMNRERDDASREMNHILADDVFSYVEEALRRESGGPTGGPTGGPLLQGSDHAGSGVSGLISGLSVQSENPGFSQPGSWWPPATDVFGGEVPIGHLNRVGGASRAASQGCVAQQYRSSALWPPTAVRHRPGHETAPHPSWLPSTKDTHESASGTTELSQRCSLTLSASQQTSAGPQAEGPSLWRHHQQQQQLSPSLHHHTLSHSSHTPGGVSSAAHPRTRPLSGSCMYEKREGHMPSAGPLPSRQNGPLLGPTCIGGATHVAGTTDAAAFPLPPHTHLHQGATPTPTLGSGHLSGNDTNGGTRRPESGPMKSSFYCWNGEVQIPKVPLPGAMEPFTFPVRPAGSINLSQNMAP